MTPPTYLTFKKRQALRLIVQDYSVPMLAEALKISLPAAMMRCRRLYTALGVHGAAGALLAVQTYPELVMEPEERPVNLIGHQQGCGCEAVFCSAVRRGLAQ